MILSRLFSRSLRIAALAMGVLLPPSMAAAGTITGLTAVTVPANISNATNIGPQSVQIKLQNPFTPSLPLNLQLLVSGASFATTSTPTISLTGTPDASICSTTSFVDKLVIRCTPPGGTVLTGISIAGLTYTNATILNTAGGTIKLSGLVTDLARGLEVEDIPSRHAVTATPRFILTTGIISNGGTGTVDLSPNALSATTAGTAKLSTFLSGTNVTLTATAASPTSAVSWQGANCSAGVGISTCTVAMVANTTISAVFGAPVATGPSDATYTLTTKKAGTGTGTVAVTPSSGTYPAGAVVTLNATATSDSTFSQWVGGGCSAIATCAVVMNENKTVTAIFTLTSTTPGNPSDNAAASHRLAVGVTGGGAVNSSPGGISCTSICFSDFKHNQAVVLTAVASGGAQFSGWTGCTPITANTCLVTVKEDATVTANFGGGGGSAASVLRLGAVYSSTQTSGQSMFRFYNGGSTPGTVTVTLADYLTGETLTQWTSPPIAAAASPQFALSLLESDSKTPFTAPAYYSATIQPNFTGTFQHVLFRAVDGVLTNLSNCDSSVTAPPLRLVNVHSSRLEGYPSQVVIHNTGTTATTFALAIGDAADGQALGTYPTASIPPNGELVLPMSTIETASGIVPTGSVLHYVVTLQGASAGYLQHRVTNQQAGVVTDMNTVCAFSGGSSSTPTPVTPSDQR